ncbi:MAG: alpha/beta fold hydrolase [Chloroflexi bacterium]|nr:alpha/beta fold hydrolase [Chloroflexota bacterium]
MPYLETNGCNYHYQIEGEGPPLFMLHGIIQSGEEFRRAGWVEALSSLRTLILVDLPGHGKSSRPEEQNPYAIESIAQSVLDIAAQQRYERFDYFGFSLGGRVGFELAARHPEVLGKLIIAAQHARPPVAESRLPRLIGLFRSGKLRAMERGMGIRPEAGSTTVNDPESMERAIQALSAWRGAEDVAGDFKMPVLCVSGEDDPAFDRARETAAQIQGVKWHPLREVDHNGAFYGVEGWRSVVTDFLAD